MEHVITYGKKLEAMNGGATGNGCVRPPGRFPERCLHAPPGYPSPLALPMKSNNAAERLLWVGDKFHMKTEAEAPVSIAKKPCAISG